MAPKEKGKQLLNAKTLQRGKLFREVSDREKIPDKRCEKFGEQSLK